jgi:DNA gyrase subunit A
VVTENGMGKRSEVEYYRITNRGGKGVRAMNITEKTGKLVAIKEVDDTNDVMIINKSGITIRLSVKDLRVLGRVTQGVRLINIGGKDEIASVAIIDYIPGVEEEEEEGLQEGAESVIVNEIIMDDSEEILDDVIEEEEEEIEEDEELDEGDSEDSDDK